MELNELAKSAQEDSMRWFPHMQTLPLQALCLTGEAGEVANAVKKIVRITDPPAELVTQHELRDHLIEEMVDVLTYLLSMMGNPMFEDINWQGEYDAKRKYNERRFS